MLCERHSCCTNLYSCFDLSFVFLCCSHNQNRFGCNWNPFIFCVCACVNVSTLWVKKHPQYYSFITLPNVDQFSNFFWHLDLAGNLQYNFCHVTHHTLNTLHYLAKISAFWNGRRPRSFIKPVAPIARTEFSILQNWRRNAAAGLAPQSL